MGKVELGLVSKSMTIGELVHADGSDGHICQLATEKVDCLSMLGRAEWPWTMSYRVSTCTRLVHELSCLYEETWH